MSRIGLANMAWGFFMIFFAACGGVFVALRSTEIFMANISTPQWDAIIHASSHGHSSMFGLLHILLGLTMPYGSRNPKFDIIKSLGLAAGSFGMGPLMLIRAALGPTLSTELNGILIGIFLSVGLASIFAHSFDLTRKVILRN